MLRPGARLVGIAAGLGIQAGCVEPDAQVRLQQSQFAGWQQNIELLSKQVYWAEEDDTSRLLAEFPLPGAMTGNPMYLLYLRWPAESSRVEAGRQPGEQVRGFFIQTRGEHAGLALVTGGEVSVKGRSRGRGAVRRVEIDLVCEDGTKLTGRLMAKRDDWIVHRFETRERPVDVQALMNRGG